MKLVSATKLIENIKNNNNKKEGKNVQFSKGMLPKEGIK